MSEGFKIYIGNIDPDMTAEAIEEIAVKYGKCTVWLAKNPPGFAFATYDDERDAQDAVKALEENDKGWRVEMARPRRERRDGGGRGGGGGGDRSCYSCGRPGHIARDCPSGGGGGRGGGGGSRYDDRRRDRDYDDRRRDGGRDRDYDRRDRSPRRETRDRSPPRRRDYDSR